IERAGEQPLPVRAEVGAADFAAVNERFSHKASAVRVPDAVRATVASGCHELAIGTPLDEPNSLRLAHRLRDEPSGAGVPDAGNTALRARGDGSAIWTEAGPQHRALMPEWRQGRLSSGRIPKLSGAIGGRGKQPT